MWNDVTLIATSLAGLIALFAWLYCHPQTPEPCPHGSGSVTLCGICQSDRAW